MVLDITVYPELSPRIVLVNYPQVEATLQDIVNAVRHWEDSEDGIGYDYILDAAGKQDLGGGTKVGITATFRNTQLRFAARPTALGSGTATSNDASGRVLTDSGADFETMGAYPGCTVYNYTTGAMETVVHVDTTQLTSFPLQAGSRQDWQIGDSYIVYPNELCQITGGNLVAVDEYGDMIDPVLQAPNINVIRSSSSSATLQELLDLQHASFNGGVTIDVTSPYSGIVYPVGTPRQPVNNLVDALLIKNTRGFTRFYVVGDLTIDSGGDYTGMIWEGESETKSTIDISAPANVQNCEFLNAHVTGTLDGGAKLKNCLLTDLNYIDGYIELCILNPGTIVLSGVDAAHFLDCWCGVVDGDNMPVIDMGGSGSNLVIRNFNGCLKITNKNGSDESVSVDLNSGHVFLSPTVTAGSILIRGIGDLTDESSGADVDSLGLVNPKAIASLVWDEILSAHSIAGSAAVLMKEILGLVQSNFRLFDTDHDTNNNLTSAKIRIYPTAADADNDENHLAEFAIVATYDGPGKTLTYKMTKVQTP